MASTLIPVASKFLKPTVIFWRQVTIEFHVASALEPEQLKRFGRFDLVYAWGSLHHTGCDVEGRCVTFYDALPPKEF